jgi:hypothetical protein
MDDAVISNIRVLALCDQIENGRIRFSLRYSTNLGADGMRSPQFIPAAEIAGLHPSALGKKQVMLCCRDWTKTPISAYFPQLPTAIIVATNYATVSPLASFVVN